MEHTPEIKKRLMDLHTSYLKSNPYDEGDPLFYRITYRLAEEFNITKEEASRYHNDYHIYNPRRVSEGFCEICDRVVTIIPIIYGVQEGDLNYLKNAELQGRLIIGEISQINATSKAALFGCQICKTPLVLNDTA